MTPLPIVLALTGASGAPYGVRLLRVLAEAKVPTWLIVSVLLIAASVGRPSFSSTSDRSWGAQFEHTLIIQQGAALRITWGVPST